MTARQQYSLGQSPGDANLSFLVDDTGDGVIAASYPINATEASYEMPTAWQLVPSTTGRLTFNHVFHYHVVGCERKWDTLRGSDVVQPQRARS